MSQPSQVLAEIVTSLKPLLGDEVAEVKAIDGDLSDDDRSVTTKPIAVLVTFLGFQSVTFNWDPPTAAGHFAAFCLAKHKSGDRSQGDVAADVAALVAAHVARNKWGALQKAPYQIRAVNLHKPANRKGASVWAVEWIQDMPLTPALDPATYNYLRSISTTYLMGDAATPDIQSLQEFPDEQ